MTSQWPWIWKKILALLTVPWFCHVVSKTLSGTIRNITDCALILPCGKQDWSSICRWHHISGNQTPSLHAYPACVEAACHGSWNSDHINHKHTSSSWGYYAHSFYGLSVIVCIETRHHTQNIWLLILCGVSPNGLGTLTSCWIGPSRQSIWIWRCLNVCY